jgi:lysophospholipase L1-like esterase
MTIAIEPHPTLSRVYHNFVGMGDSITQGICDPVAGLKTLGWADRLAQALRQLDPDLTYTNLGERGLASDLVLAIQLPRALEIKPDLVCMMVGGNNALRKTYKSELFEADFSHMLEELAELGATLVTGTIPDFSSFMPINPNRQALVSSNLAQVNEIITQVSAAYGALCVDFSTHPLGLDRTFWSEDGHHPNAHGYLMMAREIALALQTVTPISLDALD